MPDGGCAVQRLAPQPAHHRRRGGRQVFGATSVHINESKVGPPWAVIRVGRHDLPGGPTLVTIEGRPEVIVTATPKARARRRRLWRPRRRLHLLLRRMRLLLLLLLLLSLW